MDSGGGTDVREDVALRAYREHGAELYRFARRWTGDRGAAEDLVQDVVLRAWSAADGFDPSRASLRTWLFAIARNVAIDHGRRRAVRPATATDPASLEPGPVADHVDDVLRADIVARALQSLSRDHRAAIVETYLRDRPYDEVAAELGVPASTVRSRVFHGLRAMRETMLRAQEREEVEG